MRYFAAALIVLMALSSAWAGTIDPDLAAKIQNADPKEQFPTLIFMSSQLDVMEMKIRHNLANATRAQRHYEVITELQRIATESQINLLDYLAGRQASGAIGNFQSFWITNMITAELTAAEIYAVASRDDVDEIYSEFYGDLIDPIIDENYAPPTINSVEVGVRAVKADSMWRMGITGAGRLVCNIDTGVYGTHPALNHSWRGSNGYPPSESWYDSANPNNPNPIDGHGHGTHTMGTICGRSITTADTIGVAIDAQWIAARAVDVSGGNIAASFQWAADPDRDPNTIDDVPDVISNSWGAIGGCPATYYSLIDNCEAAGAAVVFAAGNEGPSPRSLRIPANRITTPYNCFSVGAVNGANNSFPIASFSSRGPSQCDNSTIKPEVCAPGVNVRSSIPGGGYQGGWSGTSMACPHVAGAIALLRQINPNASVDTLKWALMESAQDLGTLGEDNTYGWGMINIPAAMELLPGVLEPNISVSGARVVEPNDNYPDPGETIDLFIKLSNSGIAAENVFATLSTTDEYTSISSDSVFYGDIDQNDTSATAESYVISFQGSMPPGRTVEFSMDIHGDNHYAVTRQVSLRVGRLSEPAIATHDIGNVLFTISNFGQYGLAPTGINGIWDGEGFKMPQSGTNLLYEGALMIGDGPTRVSNGARDADQNMGDDFSALDEILLLEPGPFADQEYHTIFNDQAATNPLGIIVTQRSYAFSAPPDDNFVIVEYSIANTGSQTLEGVLVAHFDDWDMPWDVANDRANFDRGRNLGYQYDASNYRGQAVLSPLGVFSFKALNNTDEVYPPHFTLEDKWAYMNAGITDTAITTQMDCSVMITTGPYDIPAGDSVLAAFAMLGGTSLAGLRDNADAAIARYGTMTDIDGEQPNVPGTFFLSQNYPNPFNANTSIEFGLSSSGDVRIEAFDLLGRRVAVLADGRMSAGVHTVIWDCSELSSGVYFYKLTAENKSAVKKMTLIK